MSNWLTKLAKRRYLYHGTSIKNLSSILSEGLNFHHSRQVWTLEQNKEDSATTSPSSRASFPGIYLTDNLLTAIGSAGRANTYKKLPYNNKVIVGVDIEDRTPSIVLDEDLLRDPKNAFDTYYHVTGQGYFYGGWLQHSQNEAPEVAKHWLNKTFSEYTDRFKEKFRIIWLLPYAIPVIIAYAKVFYADEYQHTKWTSDLDTNFPDAETSLSKARSEYRNALDIFLQKVNFLSRETKEYQYQHNVRIKDPISYHGANRIVLVATIKTNNIEHTYYNTVHIHYLSDHQILGDFVSQMKQREGENFIIQDNSGKVYYDHPVAQRQEQLATARAK
jgi:hypothetical protein